MDSRKREKREHSEQKEAKAAKKRNVREMERVRDGETRGIRLVGGFGTGVPHSGQTPDKLPVRL